MAPSAIHLNGWLVKTIESTGHASEDEKKEPLAGAKAFVSNGRTRISVSRTCKYWLPEYH